MLRNNLSYETKTAQLLLKANLPSLPSAELLKFINSYVCIF